MRQKVGIVGAGGVGTFFGVRLAEAGHKVRFLLSRKRQPPATLTITSWQGNASLSDPDFRDNLGDDLDWILVCLKSTALSRNDRGILDNFAIGQNTRVQLLMNGLGAEELAAKRFGAKRVHGGLVYGGFTRLGDTVKHEGVPAEIRGGSFVDDPTEVEAAQQLWADVNVTYTPQPCLLLAQWSKLAWNIPFNGLTVAAGGCSVKDVWRPDNKQVAVQLMREVCSAANADLQCRGKPILDENQVIRTLSVITDKMAAASYIPSTTLDFNARRPMEIDAIFAEPLRRASSLGVDTPRLEALTNLLLLLNEPLLNT